MLLDRYPTVVIGVEELDGKTAAERLRQGQLSGGETDGLTVSLPVPERAAPQWIYGTEEWGLTEPGWPRWLVETGAGAVPHVEPLQPLLVSGQPFYPSLTAAVAERVFHVTPDRLRLGQHPPVSLRLTERRGRIAAIEIRGDEVAVLVEEGVPGGLAGFALRGAWRLLPEAREWWRDDHELEGSGRVQLPIEEVPAELVVVLVDPDGHEVDRRSWDDRFDSSSEEPEDLGALVSRWLGEGEHAHLEYKQTLKEAKARLSFAETVAAFANGAGGAILIGADDEGRPVGYDAAKAADQVANVIAGLVEEEPHFDVTEVEIGGRPIVVVRVAPSPPQRLPHQVRGRVMVRALATTRAATPGQLRRLIASDAAGSSPIEGWR
jgi:Putative DNA-binding domain